MAIRVQRQYYKKLPPNTKSVTRPHKFGNPLKIVGDMIYINASYRRKILDKWVFLCHGDLEFMLKIYESILYRDYQFFDENFDDSNIIDLQYWVGVFQSIDFSELKGKNLACFCKLGNPCHADILLQFVQSIN